MRMGGESYYDSSVTVVRIGCNPRPEFFKYLIFATRRVLERRIAKL